MARNVTIPEDEWIRYRIGRLRQLRRSVTDACTVRAIDELIDEAEERLESLQAIRPDAAQRPDG
jgi:hypothetical protein